jgi:hypothetical protein
MYVRSKLQLRHGGVNGRLDGGDMFNSVLLDFAELASTSDGSLSSCWFMLSTSNSPTATMPSFSCQDATRSRPGLFADHLTSGHAHGLGSSAGGFRVSTTVCRGNGWTGVSQSGSTRIWACKGPPLEPITNQQRQVRGTQPQMAIPGAERRPSAAHTEFQGSGVTKLQNSNHFLCVFCNRGTKVPPSVHLTNHQPSEEASSAPLSTTPPLRPRPAVLPSPRTSNNPVASSPP